MHAPVRYPCCVLIDFRRPQKVQYTMNTSTYLYAIIFAFALLSPISSLADEFAKVRCDSDVTKALIGQREQREPVVIIESRHKNINLRHLGAFIISEDSDMNTIGWSICGREYQILDKKNIITDVIEFPVHSKDMPAYEGRCFLNGIETRDSIVAVLDRSSLDAKLLQAKSAWRVDEKKEKFIRMNASQLLCPQDGIYTVDEK